MTDEHITFKDRTVSVQFLPSYLCSHGCGKEEGDAECRGIFEDIPVCDVKCVAGWLL